jgi:hypothetical protein
MNQCIERLLSQLASRGIARVVFDRRHKELDARDRAMLTALQRQQSLPAALRASWEPAANEPLLWLPDIAAGAASLAEVGHDTYWKELAAAFTVEKFWLD